jgi:Domain of unknown function (DUF4399)
MSHSLSVSFAGFEPGSKIRRNLELVPIVVCAAVVFLASALTASAESPIPRTASPEGAQVYFITPEDGQTLKSPVAVRFGLRGMGVAPAGVEKAATGHHHLIVDAELPSNSLPIPATDHYRHFGKGQTEVALELEPGTHSLQLLLGDKNHVPHDPPVVSKRITIVVE